MRAHVNTYAGLFVLCVFSAIVAAVLVHAFSTLPMGILPAGA